MRRVAFFFPFHLKKQVNFSQWTQAGVQGEITSGVFSQLHSAMQRHEHCTVFVDTALASPPAAQPCPGGLYVGQWAGAVIASVIKPGFKDWSGPAPGSKSLSKVKGISFVCGFKKIFFLLKSTHLWSQARDSVFNNLAWEKLALSLAVTGGFVTCTEWAELRLLAGDLSEQD